MNNKIVNYLVDSGKITCDELDSPLRKLVSELTDDDINNIMNKGNGVYDNTRESIINDICNKFSISRDYLSSKTKKRDIVSIRHACHVCLYVFTNSTLFDIGNATGVTNHTTIIHSLKQCNNKTYLTAFVNGVISSLPYKKIRENYYK